MFINFYFLALALNNSRMGWLAYQIWPLVSQNLDQNFIKLKICFWEWLMVCIYTRLFLTKKEKKMVGLMLKTHKFWKSTDDLGSSKLLFLITKEDSEKK